MKKLKGRDTVELVKFSMKAWTNQLIRFIYRVFLTRLCRVYPIDATQPPA